MAASTMSCIFASLAPSSHIQRAPRKRYQRGLADCHLPCRMVSRVIVTGPLKMGMNGVHGYKLYENRGKSRWLNAAPAVCRRALSQLKAWRCAALRSPTAALAPGLRRLHCFVGEREQSSWSMAMCRDQLDQVLHDEARLEDFQAAFDNVLFGSAVEPSPVSPCHPRLPKTSHCRPQPP